MFPRTTKRIRHRFCNLAPCRDCSSATSTIMLETLDFMHFYKYTVLVGSRGNGFEKELRNDIKVSVVVVIQDYFLRRFNS